MLEALQQSKRVGNKIEQPYAGQKWTSGDGGRAVVNVDLIRNDCDKAWEGMNLLVSIVAINMYSVDLVDYIIEEG